MSERPPETQTPPEPVTEPVAPEPSPRSRRFPTTVVAIAGLILLLITIVGTSPYWAALLPWAPESDLAARVAALEERPDADATAGQRLATLDQRVGRIEAQIKTPAPAAATDPALLARIATLEQRLRDLPAAETNAIQPLQNDLRQTADRVAKLEDQLRSAGTGNRQDQALVLAVGQLHAAVASSRPFASELAALGALGHDRPDLNPLLQPLQAPAPKGIPSVAILAQHFGLVSDRILRAAATPAGESFVDRMLARVQSLVTIRHVGAPGKPVTTGNPTEDAVNSAEAALTANDLTGAVASVKTLGGTAGEAAEPWLAEAEGRLAAEAAVARLEAYATQAVAGGKAVP